MIAVSTRLALGFLVLLACCVSGRAEGQAPPAGGRQADIRAAAKADKGFAWIHLKSGAWIKGRVHTMRDGTLEFAAQGVDDNEYGWGDVVELYSPFDNIYARVGWSAMTATRKWSTMS